MLGRATSRRLARRIRPARCDRDAAAPLQRQRQRRGGRREPAHDRGGPARAERYPTGYRVEERSGHTDLGQRTLRPAHEVVFDLVVPPAEGGQRRQRQKAFERRSAEVVEVAGHVEVHPVGAECPGLHAVGVGNADDEDAARRELALELTDGRERIGQVLEHMPHRDRVERTPAANRVQAVEHLVVLGRLVLGAKRGFDAERFPACARSPAQEGSIAAAEIEDAAARRPFREAAQNLHPAPGAVFGREPVATAPVLRAIVAGEVGDAGRGHAQVAGTAGEHRKALSGHEVPNPVEARRERHAAERAFVLARAACARGWNRATRVKGRATVG